MEHVHHCSCSKYIACIYQIEDGVPQKALETLSTRMGGGDRDDTSA